MILRIQHAQITIPNGEEDAAREFYCDFLGLKEVPKPESLRGRGGFWLELDGFQIHVGAEDDFDRSKTKAHIAYQVEDLTAWRDKLEKRGAKSRDSEFPAFRVSGPVRKSGGTSRKIVGFFGHP